MRQPKRLLADGATDFERQLLQAVMNERPSAVLRSRMQHGLGLEGPITWAGNAKAMLATLQAKASSAVAVAGVVGAGAVAALVGLDSPRMTESDAARVSGAADATPVMTAPQPANAGEPPRPAAASTQGAEVGSIERDYRLREEIAALDAARIALQEGAPARALAGLERYAKVFPEGTLMREAELLRRQARAAKRASLRRSKAARDGAALSASTPERERRNGTPSRSDTD